MNFMTNKPPEALLKSQYKFTAVMTIFSATTARQLKKKFVNANTFRDFDIVANIVLFFVQKLKTNKTPIAKSFR